MVIWNKIQFKKNMKTSSTVTINTRGGRHSFACLRRTEKPPWVLVSEAVKTLQKECTVDLGGSGWQESGLTGSAC